MRHQGEHFGIRWILDRAVYRGGERRCAVFWLSVQRPKGACSTAGLDTDAPTENAECRSELKQEHGVRRGGDSGVIVSLFIQRLAAIRRLVEVRDYDDKITSWAEACVPGSSICIKLLTIEKAVSRDRPFRLRCRRPN